MTTANERLREISPMARRLLGSLCAQASRRFMADDAAARVGVRAALAARSVAATPGRRGGGP